MGRASREKWERKIQEAKDSALQANLAASKLPWYESNLLWGPLATAIAGICLAVGAMKGGDFRILLWLSWFVAIYPFWLISKNLGARRPKIIILLFIVLLSSSFYGIYRLYLWLEPSTPMIAAPETPEQIETKLRGWIEKAGVYKVSKVAADPTDDFRFDMLSRDFDATISKAAGKDFILIHSGLVFLFDSKKNPAVASLVAEDKDQLIRDVKLELLRMRIGYKIYKSDRDDFSFNLRLTPSISSLSEQELLENISRLSGAAKATETIVMSKINQVANTYKNKK